MSLLIEFNYGCLAPHSITFCDVLWQSDLLLGNIRENQQHVQVNNKLH